MVSFYQGARYRDSVAGQLAGFEAVWRSGSLLTGCWANDERKNLAPPSSSLPATFAWSPRSGARRLDVKWFPGPG